MKISKIFHTLYACLLLLPIGMFLTCCVNYGFNDSYTTESVSYYDYEKLTFNQLLENGNFNDTSKWTTRGTLTCNNNVGTITFNSVGGGIRQDVSVNSGHTYVVRCSVKLSSTYTDCVVVRIGDGSLYSYNSFSPSVNTWFNINFLTTISSASSFNGFGVAFDWDDITSDLVVNVKNFNLFDLTLMYGEGNEPSLSTFNSIFSNDYYDYSTGYNLILDNSTTITSSGFVQNLYKRYLDIWDLPMFRWAKDSFLVQPFNYIANLFGFGANALVYTIDYWLCISIIWLVFDLLIYVPNLCHRWLDRGAIE